MLRIYSVEGNRQRLDGGAMFGNAPRPLWSRWCSPDDHGRIELSCRALLVDEGDRKVLLETGIGAFFEPDRRERYGVVEAHHVLLQSLGRLGLSDEDIDVVVLSHLHFDHAGGLLAAHEPGAGLRLLFPRARFVVGRVAFERARAPHLRDRASFVPGLPELLEASGRLELVEPTACASPVLGDRYALATTDGHTPGMMHTTVRGKHDSIFFGADLVPGVPWVHLPITMGYDRFPEQLVDEKRRTLEHLAASGAWLFFTHDLHVAAARVAEVSGRYQAVEACATLDGRDLD
jgi:glyoxylase-like metal-dependent hydrolase (beta-lactamase superfamily II)